MLHPQGRAFKCGGGNPTALHDIDTQEELAARLNSAGFKVTQATVSRDIRALKLTKVAGKDGKSRYAVLSGASVELGDKALYWNVPTSSESTSSL